MEVGSTSGRDDEEGFLFRLLEQVAIYRSAYRVLAVHEHSRLPPGDLKERRIQATHGQYTLNYRTHYILYFYQFLIFHGT